jgi:hypothetical protein
MDIQDNLNKRFALLESKKDDDPAKQFRKEAIKKVLDRIFAGGSALKTPLQAGSVSLADVVKAIKTKRCLRTPDQDFGATYLEQILGAAVRDSVPVDAINSVRKIFGLDKLSKSDLFKHAAREKQAPKQAPKS